MQLPHIKIKPAPMVITHAVTLRQLYNATTQKVTYTRSKLKPDGKSTELETVDQYIGLKPEWEEGAIASFAGAGEEGVDILPGDVEVEMVIAPDASWAREGSTLEYTAIITLTEVPDTLVISLPHKSLLTHPSLAPTRALTLSFPGALRHRARNPLPGRPDNLHPHHTNRLSRLHEDVARCAPTARGAVATPPSFHGHGCSPAPQALLLISHS